MPGYAGTSTADFSLASLPVLLYFPPWHKGYRMAEEKRLSPLAVPASRFWRHLIELGAACGVAAAAITGRLDWSRIHFRKYCATDSPFDIVLSLSEYECFFSDLDLTRIDSFMETLGMQVIDQPAGKA